jgi:DNA-binding transcriptional LysR family regulator
MNFAHLKAFYHVADCKSFTVASQRLNVSQSTLSLQVQSLERRFGLSLIKRHKKSFELTTEGELVFSYARSIFSLVYNLDNVVEDLNTRNLKIGSTPTLAHYIMPNVIRSLKETNPQLKIQLYTGLSKEVLQKVINYEYHVGLIGQANFPGNIIKRQVAEPRLYFITSDSEFPARIHLRDLADYPLILAEEGSTTRAYIIERFRKLGVPLNDCIDCENAQAIKDMVHLGIGGAFFPIYAIEADIRENKYRKIEIVDDLHLTISIIYLRERRKIEILKKFLDAVKESAFSPDS